MISVCIATFNGQRFIKEQILSILSQLSLEDEVIINDDLSIDNTVDIINSLNDKRIKLIVNKNQLGVNGNFSAAISRSIGDYIFLSDQDDIWLENKVSIVLKELKKSSNLVLHNAIIVNSKLETIHKSYFSIRNPNISIYRNIIKNSFTGCFMAFPKDLVDNFLPIPKGVPHDWWFGTLSLKIKRFSIIDRPLVIWRRHENNVTDIFGGKLKNIFIQLSIRIKLTVHILLKS